MSRASTLGKVLKTIFILLVIVALVLCFYFGIMKSTNAADAPIDIPVGLGLYPSDITADTTWAPNFSLEEFLDPTADGYYWDNKSEDGTIFFKGEFDSSDVYSAGSPNDATVDAINLLRLASYNQNGLPYYGYFTDAGGGADIAGTVKGDLMSQTIHVQEGDEFFHQNINAIVEGDVPMSELIKTTAVAILNKARRQLSYGGNFYTLQGDSPIYVYGEDFLDAAGKPTVFDDGRCTASWLAAVTKEGLWTDDTKKDIKTLTPGTEEYITRFKEVYTNMYILSLCDSDYTGTTPKPSTWFTDSKTTIEKVYTDAQGNESTTATDHYFLRCSMTADLPERGNLSLEAWETECNNKNINKAKGEKLKGYTGANPVCFTALKYTFEVWDCGLLRSWRTDEGWLGTLAGLVTGDVTPFNPTTYTYVKDYCKIADFTEMLGVTAA